MQVTIVYADESPHEQYYCVKKIIFQEDFSHT